MRLTVLHGCNSMAPQLARRRAVDIIVPFHKHPEIVFPLFASIRRLQSELRDLDCTIIAVNDSPDDVELKQALIGEASRLDGILECTILENEANEGYVRSANRALRETIGRGHDAILLNSDTVLFPRAVSEMQRVAYLDPAIGFVSPRSNNATLCSLPHQHEYNSLPSAESFAIYSVLAGYLPDHHYVPTGVGFCLYIKLSVLEQVGILDDTYSPGYNEENDLIMRGHARGHRVALANHAYVYHVGSASFSTSATLKAELDKRNLVTLTERYPHFKKHVEKYYASEHLQAELLLPGLLTDSAGRWDLLLDLSALPPRDDPSSRAIKEVAIRAVERWRPWFNIFVTGRRESLEFHQLHEISGVSTANLETSRIFAIAVSFGLPCEHERVIRLGSVAVCNVYAVLDPMIAGTPSFEAPLLDELCDFVFQYADGVIYESQVARDRFRAQYKCHPAVRECVADLSGVRNFAATGTAWIPDGTAVAHATPAVQQSSLNPCLDDWSSDSSSQHGDEPFVREQNQDSSGAGADEAWASATQVIGHFLKETVEFASFEMILKRRLRSIRLLKARMISREIESSRDQALRDLEKLKRENEELKREGEELKRENEELKKVNREHFEEIEVSRRERKQALDALENLRREVDQVRQRGERAASDLRAEIGKGQLEIADLRRSWSWRLTAPLRKLGEVVLHRFGRSPR